ncbi:LysR family transcriptional regulator [Micavibrio aeruginosavorus]|uniref:Transcriptional regulator, LysR family n=1 Tax=Micavibrio aeruginosavorus EPB TaxID=349215 RepID=M4VKR9_9BACT|nr:LysR family transcriptional regulator [Micavibrio aeruginosavorus]AGH98696.1 transcriptional regulator, LysR family [Micavibrio aeruginosavorus EPB]
MDKFANMQAFQAVAENGSFADAARRLNLANSVVSKRIKDLEDFLGVQLLVRTTRQVTLTESGQHYLDHVRQLLGDMEEVEASLRYQTQKPVGTIKLTAPLSFGLQTLAPALASYLDKYPDVSIRTYLSDRRVDLVGESYDLAIRIGALTDPTLMAKKLCAGRRVVCATPAYFKTHGRPQSPADLKAHNCLSYINLAEGKSWPFIKDGKKIWQAVSGNFLSDNGDLLHQAALAGCGITMLPTFIVDESLAAKKLEVVLEDYEEKDFDVYAVYQQTRHLSVKIRTLIDHLHTYLAQSH